MAPYLPYLCWWDRPWHGYLICAFKFFIRRLKAKFLLLKLYEKPNDPIIGLDVELRVKPDPNPLTGPEEP